MRGRPGTGGDIPPGPVLGWVAREVWGAGPTSPPSSNRAARWRGVAIRHLLLLVLYTFITAALTYPTFLHPATRLPGAYSDAYQNYWNYWWIDRALASGSNPFWTPLVYAPDGAPLYLHTLNIFNGLVTLPLQWLFGVTSAYNGVIFLSFTLSAYCTYLLVVVITGSRLAGFAGGLIYAFGSYQMTQLLQEHPNLCASEWLPAYILCLLMAHEWTGRRRTGMIGVAVITIVLMLLVDWQYIILALLFTILHTCYLTLARRSIAPALTATAIGLLAGLASLPLLWPTIRQVGSGEFIIYNNYAPQDFSADLLSFFLPSSFQSWWGGTAARLGGEAVSPVNEKSIFLGYIPLVLAVVGCWRNRALAGFWAGAALTFALFALGPFMRVAGQEHLGPAGRLIPLPYWIVQQVPGLNISRYPVRFSLGVTLCLAVLAGLGLARAERRLPARLGARGWRVLVALLLSALVIEHLVVPVPTRLVEAPPFYQQLAASSEVGAVLEWPFSLKRSRSLFYQTIHGHPIVGGYLSRPRIYPLRDLPPLSDRIDGAPDITGTADVAAGRQALAWSGVHWIVVLLDDPYLDRVTLPQFLERYARPEVLYQDATMAVYRPLPPDDLPLYIGVAGGFYGRETLDDRRTIMRWIGIDGQFGAWNFTDVPQEAVLRFDAWSFATPRRLEVLLDDQPLGQWLISSRQTHAIPLTITPGPHRVQLRSLDPPVAPSSLGEGADQRLLSIGVASVELRR